MNGDMNGDMDESSKRMRRGAQPLLRLLAINLAIGAIMAALMVGGLVALNAGGLRDLALADGSPGVALALLLLGFFITFGSVAMGTAIMALGRCDHRGGNARRGRRPDNLALQRNVAQRPGGTFPLARDSGGSNSPSGWK